MEDRRIDFLMVVYRDWWNRQGFAPDRITCVEELQNSGIRLDHEQIDWLRGFCAVWETVQDAPISRT